MKAKEVRIEIQRLLGNVSTDGIFGEIQTWPALRRLAAAPDGEEWPPIAPIPGATRRISDDGIALVKHFEGRYLKAYQDSVDVWTIGFGHTGLTHRDGSVFRGRTITEAEAEALLRYDMGQFEARVVSFVKVLVDDDEFAALVSFDFNTGGLGRSTLLAKLNADDREGASNEFLKWDKAGGQTLRGLTRRRQSERNLFLGKRPFIVDA